MALFSESKLKKLRYPYNTARMVSLVKAIETSDAGGKYWSKTEAEEITAELSRETTPGSRSAPRSPSPGCRNVPRRFSR